MSEQFRMLLVLGVTITVMIFSINIQTYSMQSKFLKEDLEVAIHDASLQVDKESLSNGYIVFDQDSAKQVFMDTMKKNTGLTEGEDYTVVEWEFFDHDTHNTGFACEQSSNPIYEYSSSKVDASYTVTCPTILAIIKHTSENYFVLPGDIKEGKDNIKGAAYTYEFNPDALNTAEISSLRMVNSFQTNSELVRKGDYFWPLPYTQNVTSHFKKDRINPVSGIVKDHTGTDLSSAGVLNQPAVAIADGVITYAGTAGGYGNLVEVRHEDGLVTRYAHLNSITVSKNQKISGGDVVGLVGSTGNSTGPHLHFETVVNGTAIDPLTILK